MMSTMKTGLRPTCFLFSLKKWLPKDHVELLAQANKYISAKEDMVDLHSEKTDKKKKSKHTRDDLDEPCRSLRRMGRAPVDS